MGDKIKWESRIIMHDNSLLVYCEGNFIVHGEFLVLEAFGEEQIIKSARLLSQQF